MPRSRLLATVLWLGIGVASAGWLFAAMNLRSPYLLGVRETVGWLWMAVGFLALIWILLRGKRNFPHPLHLLAAAVLLGSLLAGHGRWLHFHHRQRVMDTPASGMPAIGKHLIVGWLGFEETRALAAKGAIAGIFLSRHDFPPLVTIAEIRRTVDALQAARQEAGLPPLWVAADQEGGPVAKLTPPLPRQPALGTLLTEFDGPGLATDPERAAAIVSRVTAYADVQGQALAAAGINMNFAPVVDLRPATPPDALDLHSRIANRALAADPETVTLAGETYVRVLKRHGVTAILKHFPGLGRVPADTHHFAARLDASAAELAATDWLPFREISRHAGAGIMLGHVRVTALDPERPASGSPATVDLLRKKWGATGLLVTDDFSMSPISHGRGGIVRAAAQSMAAGVDLILLSYDGAAVYDLLGANLEKRPPGDPK
ncbi:MAG: glycoside hydrolase family 3 N-terminal domain-containing protein [Verrucomicrobiota bacterium]